MCHLGDQLVHGRLRLPPENGPSLGGVATQVYRIGWAQEVLFGAHVLLPIKSETRKGCLRNFSHRMRDPAGKDEIICSRVIENHQETFHDVARIAPVSPRIEIP